MCGALGPMSMPKCLLGASLVPPWCLLGASLVPPWCLLGASLVPPWCLPAPLDLVPGPFLELFCAFCHPQSAKMNPSKLTLSHQMSLIYLLNAELASYIRRIY
mgnify:CR=1 FL=1